MIRGAAKNHAHVAVLTDPAQYGPVLDELRKARRDALGRDPLPAGRGGLPAHRAVRRGDRGLPPRPGRGGPARRRGLPGAAGDRRRARAVAPLRREPAPGRRVLPPGRRPARAERGRPAPRPRALLQQPARLVGRPRPAARVRRPGRGRDQAHQPVRRRPRAGAGEAVRRAKACDPVSIYGGIVGLNRTVDLRGGEGAVRHPARDPVRARLRAGRARGDPPDQEEVPGVPAPVRAARLSGARAGAAERLGRAAAPGGDLVDLDGRASRWSRAGRRARRSSLPCASRGGWASTPSPTPSCSPPRNRWWASGPVR